MSLHRALKIGNEIFRIHAGHDLNQFPAFGAEVVKNLFCGMNKNRRGEVFPSSHESDCIDNAGFSPRLGTLKV